MTKIKELVLSLMLALGAFVAPVAILAQSSAVYAATDTACNGISECLDSGATKTDPDAAGVDATEKVNDTITLVINLFSIIVGVISVIMIIIGGMKYITSGGDSGNVTGDKNTIMYAVIGLVVVAMAQIIVKFVLEKATSTTV